MGYTLEICTTYKAMLECNQSKCDSSTDITTLQTLRQLKYNMTGMPFGSAEYNIL